MQMILMKASTRAYEHLNITLPRATVELLDRVTKKGNRSRFIDQAIRELANRLVDEPAAIPLLRHAVEQFHRRPRKRDVEMLVRPCRCLHEDHLHATHRRCVSSRPALSAPCRTDRVQLIA